MFKTRVQFCVQAFVCQHVGGVWPPMVGAAPCRKRCCPSFASQRPVVGLLALSTGCLWIFGLTCTSRVLDPSLRGCGVPVKQHCVQRAAHAPSRGASSHASSTAAVLASATQWGPHHSGPHSQPSPADRLHSGGARVAQRTRDLPAVFARGRDGDGDCADVISDELVKG